jgi:hypothetical protein
MKFGLFPPLFYEIDFFEDYLIFSNGKVFSRKSNIFLKERINGGGYRGVILRNENGDCNIQISRLVADYFVKINKRGILEVDHIDRNKLNNNYTNLRWCSRQENMLNRNKTKNNKSGFIGVSLDEKGHRWQASCYQQDEKRIHKCFTFKRNNEQDKEEKFNIACNWRQKMTDKHYNPNYFNGNK